MKKKLSLLMVALVAVAAFAYQQSLRRADAVSFDVPTETELGAFFAEKATANPGAPITLNLAKDGSYTITSSLVASNNVTINGNGATIDASGFDGDIITLDGTTEVAKKSDGTDTDHKLINAIAINGVKILGIKGALVTDAQKTLVETLTISDAVIEMPAAAKNVLNFNGKGYVGEAIVKNSTIYAKGNNTGFFAQYGSRPKNVNGDWLQQFNVQNSTIVNIANGKNFCDLKQNGTAQNVYTLKNSIFVNCGKEGQTVVGFNKGQNSATPVWDVDGNVFNFGGVDKSAAEVEKAGKKNDEDIVKNSVAGVVAFADAANGDFTLEYGSAANTAKVGDPRWIQYGITIADGIENGTVITSPATSTVAGQEVTITLTPNAGYELKPNTLKVTYMEGETEKTVAVKDGKFIMPAAAVTVKAEFWLIPEDITVNMDAAGNINDALTAAIGTKNPKNIAINLAAGGAYTISASIEAPNNLTLKGDATNPATITMAEGMTADVISLNGTQELAPKADGTLSDHKLIAAVEISGVKILGIQGALVTDAQKTLVEKLTIADAIIEMPAAAKNVLNFNGKGYVGEAIVKNSTIYANGNNTGFFAQYGSRPKNVNSEWLQQFNVQNSTFVNIANGKNICDLKQNGTAQNVYTLKNNIFVNCGKCDRSAENPDKPIGGQVVVGFNKGQTSATPVWDVDGNVFNYTDPISGHMTDVSANEVAKAGKKNEEDIVKKSVAGVVTFSETAGDFNGSFLLAPETTSMPEKIGDPRWTLTPVTSYAIAVAEGIENGTVATSVPYAAVDTEVEIKLTPADTYKVKFGSVAVTYKDGEETKNVEVSFDNKFKMPAAAVTVTAAFERVPVDIEVVAADITEGDLTAAIAAKSKAVTDVNDVVGNITVTLDGETAYKVTAPIEGAKSVVINGNGAKIDASALEDAFIKMRKTPIIDPNEKETYIVDNITIDNVQISGLKSQLFSANEVRYLFNNISLTNSVIGIQGASKKTIFDLSKAANVITFTVDKSTLWADGTTEWQNGGFFSTQTSKKLADMGVDTSAEGFVQTTTITNSTFFNIAKGKTVSTLIQNSQNWMKYVVKNNIIVNSGKNSEFLRGLNSGQAGKDANWDVEGNVINYSKGFIVEKTIGSTDENIKNAIPAIALFADADKGDFNVSFAKDPKADLVVAGVGDPRWTIGATTDAKSVDVAKTQEHATITVDKAFSMEDETVTITITPEQGYSVAKVYAKVGNTPIKVDCKEQNKTYTFTMPAMNVVVSADMEIVATDFVINVESGSITEAINKEIKYTEGEEVKTKNIKSMTINLKNAGIYTITESISCGGSIAVVGVKGAVIDASGLKKTSGEGEEATTTNLPFIAMSTTPVMEPVESGQYIVPSVKIEKVEIVGLDHSLFTDSGIAYAFDVFTVDDCVIEALQTKAVTFDFGKSMPINFNIKNSTIYSKVATSSKNFMAISGQQPKKITGYEGGAFNFTNNTFYNCATTKQFINTNSIKGKGGVTFTWTKNIFVDCGNKQIWDKLDNGNAPKELSLNTYWYDGKNAGEKYDTEVLLYNPYLKDAANGDFAVGYKTEQAEQKTGDQRWGTWENVVYTITVAEMEGGTILAPATAMADDEIQLIVVPNEGFRLKEGSLKGMMGKSEFEISEDLKFFMPVADVTIYAEFEATTGINAVKANKLDNAVIYNLQGVRVDKSQAKGGLFIVNGKKVVIK